MGTPTAPSTTPSARQALPVREGLSHGVGDRPRQTALMEVNFEIAQRAPGENVPPQDARRVGATRRIARAYLACHRMPSLTFPVTLIVSELVTNAITHSGGAEVDFTMQIQDDLLYFAVRSDVATAPTRTKASDDDEHGRGLELVDLTVSGLGGTWGIGNDGTVWCLLPAKEAAQ